MFFTSNKCFSPMTIGKKNILDATCLLKISKSRKQFLEFSILPKNERKGGKNILRVLRIIFVVFRSFFGRIKNSKNCFRDLLTFK